MNLGTRANHVEDDRLLKFEQAQRDLESRRSRHNGSHDGDPDDNEDQAIEHLNQLRRQQDELKRKQLEAQLLQDKQDRFNTTRRELGEQLQRLHSSLERDMGDLDEAGEVMENARQLLARDLQTVRGIEPDEWSGDDPHVDLDGGLATLDGISDHLEKIERRLTVVWNVVGPHARGEVSASWRTGGALACLWRGFLFSFPMMVFVTVLFILARGNTP